MEQFFSPADIDLRLACNAHAGTSFTPEKRAQQERDSYCAHMAAVVKALASIAETDQQKAVMTEQVQRYREGYIARNSAWLYARSRCLSSMITGPSNFPTQRNQKRNRTADKRLQELLDWSKRAQHAMRRAILDARTREQVEDAERQRLRKQVEEFVAVCKAIQDGQMPGFDISCFRQNFVGRMKTVMDNGGIETGRAALEYLRDLQKILKRPALTERHSIWKYCEVAEQKRKEAAAAQKSGVETLRTIGDVEIVANHDLRRVQIFFPSKPRPETLQRLKSAGWRWSRSNGCWQQWLNALAIDRADEIVRSTTSA